MRQSTKRLVSMALSLVFVVAAFVVFFNFVRPAYDEFLRIRSEQISRERFTQSQRAVIDQVKKLVSAFHEQGRIQDKVSISLPSESDVAGALAQINGLAEANRLAPQSFQVSRNVPQGALARTARLGGNSSSSPVVVPPIGTLTFKVRLGGSYEDFKNFLGNLENNIRILDAKDVGIQPVLDKQNRVASYNFDLTVATYFQTQ